MATDFSSSQFKWHSTQKSPLFDDSNYNCWKYRVKIYLQSINYEPWNIIEVIYEKTSTPCDQWTEDQKKSTNLDAKAMNVLFYALDKNEFNRVSTFTSAHQIWHILQVTHEGTNKVKKKLKYLLLCASSNYFKWWKIGRSKKWSLDSSTSLTL